MFNSIFIFIFLAVVLKLILRHHDILLVLVSATKILVSTLEPCFLTNETFAMSCLISFLLFIVFSIPVNDNSTAC